MTTVPLSSVLDSITTLLTEAYAGPPNPKSTWFIDNEPDSGILGILAGVSAAEASRTKDREGDPGSTIAANAEHLRWSLAQANSALRGQPYAENWKESWQLLNADPAGWDRLRAELRSEFEALREAIQAQSELSGDDLTGIIALLPHAAYHLGTIRQMIERVREHS